MEVSRESLRVLRELRMTIRVVAFDWALIRGWDGDWAAPIHEINHASELVWPDYRNDRLSEDEDADGDRLTALFSALVRALPSYEAEDGEHARKLREILSSNNNPEKSMAIWASSKDYWGCKLDYTKDFTDESRRIIKDLELEVHYFDTDSNWVLFSDEQYFWSAPIYAVNHSSAQHVQELEDGNFEPKTKEQGDCYESWCRLMPEGEDYSGEHTLELREKCYGTPTP